MNSPLFVIIVSLVFCIVSASNALSGEVSGPYANRVSLSDVTQIKAAVSKEPHISHNVKKIEAVRPDKVVIQTTARTAVDEDTYYDFSAYRRAGAWTIDANSIQITIEKRDLGNHGPIIIR